MEKAVEILDEMTLAGISPNEHTYTTIMHGYASLGDTGKAFTYFTKLRNEGLELDVYTYEALLKACCKSGRMQSALAVTKEMSAQNIPKNTFVYNILIDGYEHTLGTATIPCCVLCLFLVFLIVISGVSLCRWARRGDVWEAADLMQQMKRDGIQPDIHTYTSFVNACCKAGDMLVCSSIITILPLIRIFSWGSWQPI